MNPGWTSNTALEIKDDSLYIGGAAAKELVEKYDTPLFVFSEKRIKDNIRHLMNIEDVIDCKLKICYASKANSNLGVLGVVKDAGSSIEVNSGGELFIALKVGFDPEQIIFNGTSKTEKEIAEAINAGIYAIQADSFYEIELIEEVARELEKKANVSLRLVPDIETETLHGLQTALLISKFGMMPEETRQAFRRWKADDEHINLCGIHLHIGSQNPKSQPYVAALETLFSNLVKIYEETGQKLSHLNLGGGFPVNYLRDDTNIADINNDRKELFSADLKPAEVIREAWETVKKIADEADASHLLENFELLIEPGRSIISDAGVCLTKVRNKKQRPIGAAVDPDSKSDPAQKLTDEWLLTDAGFNLLLSMETYKWYYHLISADRPAALHQTPYKVAGPLCDGGDVYFDIEGENRLPNYRLLPENIEVGEVLALLNSGAYTIAQMFQYNGRELPACVLVTEDGGHQLVRKRDTYKDLITNQIEKKAV
ncbi:MAG: diaminopimelate decarboxylase [Pyrinomonadaceae bacterium]